MNIIKIYVKGFGFVVNIINIKIIILRYNKKEKYYLI